MTASYQHPDNDVEEFDDGNNDQRLQSEESHELEYLIDNFFFVSCTKRDNPFVSSALFAVPHLQPITN